MSDFKALTARTGVRHHPLTEPQWQVLKHVVQNCGTTRKVAKAKCPLYYHAVFKGLVAKGYVSVGAGGASFYPTDAAFQRVEG